MSSNTDGPGGTFGARLSNSEEPSRRRQNKETAGTAGLLKSMGEQGGEDAAAGAITTGAEEKGRTDHNVGQREFLAKAAKQTGQLGGSNTLKPTTLWESVIEAPIKEKEVKSEVGNYALLSYVNDSKHVACLDPAHEYEPFKGCGSNRGGDLLSGTLKQKTSGIRVEQEEGYFPTWR
ncbi:hypothetical protein NDU88_006524 [Pleurodeles waltl]|uniref:Uncharacterized protein n=1 Tax=Pleurodeles waltl TaxID=8319 RepID=A0AAV7NS71_PLEWA|nr:hypothetical protein NDU88_006524 [Pleurodeles waltl]